jgi:hypothetical protein
MGHASCLREEAARDGFIFELNALGRVKQIGVTVSKEDLYGGDWAG